MSLIRDISSIRPITVHTQTTMKDSNYYISSLLEVHHQDNCDEISLLLRRLCLSCEI